MFELVAKFIQKARKNELFSPFLRFFAYLALFPKMYTIVVWPRRFELPQVFLPASETGASTIPPWPH